MKRLLHDFVDLVFPNCCPGCAQPFVVSEEHLCSSCEQELPVFFADEQITDHFAGRLEVLEARAFLKFYNGGIAQKLLHNIKYKGDRQLGEYLGKLFIQRLKKDSIFNQIEVIIPVPLHKAKLRSRGYNQSELLAKGMAMVLEIKIDTTSIIRVKKSETQTRKNRAERWHNVSGIFKGVGENLIGKHVLLVDDVITTGATLEACGEEILAAGATSLSIAALAATM